MPFHITSLGSSVAECEEFLTHWRVFNGEHLALEQLRARLTRSRSIIIVARDSQSRLLAFCSVQVIFSLVTDAPFLELESIYVLPDFRLKQIAASLLQYLPTVAAAHGCNAVHATSTPDPGVQLFYAKAGFISYGTRCILKL